ncbi:hypothetical protein PVNG_05556 [Plasmodium vivax North Korean]|uniref:Pv-fam-c protein n=1 Tax=Plasmodium vivax North Korean TaxID=1035514 RepID=A0A0J9U0I2_PLAVI|nr:hypothetical protein PVNG_05556 [Plasmodium vivax North Korean]
MKNSYKTFFMIYNKDNVGIILPSDRRNVHIIHGVKFGAILKHIHNKNNHEIDSWIKKYKNTLTEYLMKNSQIWKKNDPGKYCTNLNYIIDFIVQGIYNLKEIERIGWAHQVQEITRNTLRQYTSSKCTRDIDNFENKYLLFKKLMLDLCEDIEHFKANKNIKNHKKKCLKNLSRLQYRKDTLMQLFHTFYHKEMFDIKDECSISFINNKFSDISCNKVEEQPQTVVTSEGAIETGEVQDSAHGDGLDDPGPVDPIPEDLQFNLSFNEDPPKLDTTYAAASLAGISLFGTILYKVKYH